MHFQFIDVVDGLLISPINSATFLQNVQASAQTVRELLPVMRELAPQMRDFGLQVVARLTDKMTARFLRFASDTILGPASPR